MTESGGFTPKILVFSTNNISDPGIDLAGSSHMHYSTKVVVLSLPCTSGIKPSWVLHAMQQGFDGVFIAADGEECAYLPDCSERTSKIVSDAQALLQKNGYDANRVRMAAICSVCAEPFTNYMREFSDRSGRSRPLPGGGRVKFDALVVGGGIGGMESALKLGDIGYKVLLVEKESSVGGKMILLSKVFPTLDCASCISTPKMGATIHHPNITALTYSEVESIRRDGEGRFKAKIRKKPRYVDEAACTGCRQCEMVCNVAVPDEFNADMVSRRAAHIPFPQAVPKKAVIQRAGTSPCTGACPAGIKAHGYVALVRSGQYEKAFELICEATPLVGSLGRACYAPCEEDCTRGLLEGPVSIRRLKRFVADTHYAKGPTVVDLPPRNGRKVAVVGSGPAGLTAAWHLARKGYEVKIIEAASQPGGMLRLALPPYRLPNEVVDQDIGNVLAAGVEIITNIRVENLDELREFGYEAVVLAVGTHQSTKLRVPGEDLSGVMRASEFLKAAKLGEPLNVKGKRVVVIGGGNVAMDAARTALRLRAESVKSISLESLPEMPAHPQEVEEATAEGVVLENSCGVREFQGEEKVESVQLMRCVSVFDETGRFSPQYGEDLDPVPADLVIVAAGMRPDAGAFGLPINSQRYNTGGRADAADDRPVRLRGWRRRSGAVHDHVRLRTRPPCSLHDRPLSAGGGAGRVRAGSRSPRGGQERGPWSAGHLQPAPTAQTSWRGCLVTRRVLS